MRRLLTVLVTLVVVGAFARGWADTDPRIILRRGDANDDQTVDISDALFITNWLFSGGDAPPCLNQADANDDGLVDSSDSVYLTNWLFMGGPQPPSPGPFATSCSFDASPYPGCASSSCP